MNKRATTDLVCGMKLREQQAKQFLVYDGHEYFFCSVGCRAEFQRHPEDYALTSAESEVREDV